METLLFLALIILVTSCVIGSFFMMTGRAFISVALAFLLPISNVWYIDITIYVMAFLIFTSDVGILSIASFSFMYNRELKMYRKGKR